MKHCVYIFDTFVMYSHRCFGIWLTFRFAKSIHRNRRNNHKNHHLHGYLVRTHHDHVQLNAYIINIFTQFEYFRAIDEIQRNKHFTIVCLPFLVSAIKYTIWTGICCWFIATIFFTITIIIIQSFNWYCFASLDAKEFITIYHWIVQIIVLIPYPPGHSETTTKIEKKWKTNDIHELTDSIKPPINPNLPNYYSSC